MLAEVCMILKILVAGRKRDVASYTCMQILNKGFKTIVLDNLYNTNVDSLTLLQKISGKKLSCIKPDSRDIIFYNNKKVFSIWLIGLKLAGESINNSIRCFDNGIEGSLILVQATQYTKLSSFKFNFSVIVCDAANSSPLNVHLLTGKPNNTYRFTKLVVKQMLQNTLLRNFLSVVNILSPYVTQVQIAKLVCWD